METQEVKLPHHFTPIYKNMVAEGLIVDKKYVGEIPLSEYLKSVESSDSTEEKPPTTPEGKEPTIPLSAVKAMVAEMLAESNKNQVQAKANVEFQPRFTKEEYDIDDIPEFRDWEVKDRQYTYIPGKPVSATIASKHTAEVPFQYFNEETKKVHIVRFATNQPSIFVENQSKEPGSVILGEINFKWGKLLVPASEINLQKVLHIHPLKGIDFEEYDPEAKSRETITKEKLLLKAGGLVFTVGEITNRSIASMEYPNYVDSWTVGTVEEEVLAFAKKHPQKYIDYTEDPTIKMKGVVKRALATGDLIYSNYRFLNKSREVILDVAKNQDEMDEIVKYFESGVGRTFYEFLLHSK